MFEDKTYLAKEKRQRLIDVVDGKKTNYIPSMLTMTNWIFDYSGIKFQEAMWDRKLLIDAYAKFFDGLEDADFDLLHNGYYPDFQLAHILGNDRNNIYDTNLSTYQANDVELMTPDEYPELAADPYAFMLGKILPRKYKRLGMGGDYKANAFAEGMLRFALSFPEAGAFTGFVNSRGFDHIPVGVMGYMHPLDIILDWRGIRGFCTDLRRYEKELKAAVEAMMPFCIGILMGGCFDPTIDFLSAVSISGNFMNRKNMEELFWPGFNTMAHIAAQYGKKSIMWFEGNWVRFYDIMGSLPPNNCLIWMDDEDIGKAQSMWGNKITIASNMSVNYLGTRSKEQCVDAAKKLLDDHAKDGAFVFAFDRMMVSRDDCNIENLKAVLKTIRNYR